MLSWKFCANVMRISSIWGGLPSFSSSVSACRDYRHGTTWRSAPSLVPCPLSPSARQLSFTPQPHHPRKDSDFILLLHSHLGGRLWHNVGDIAKKDNLWNQDLGNVQRWRHGFRNFWQSVFNTRQNEYKRKLKSLLYLVTHFIFNHILLYCFIWLGRLLINH